MKSRARILCRQRLEASNRRKRRRILFEPLEERNLLAIDVGDAPDTYQTLLDAFNPGSATLPAIGTVPHRTDVVVARSRPSGHNHPQQARPKTGVRAR